MLAGDWLFARAAGFAADTESVPVLKVFARTLGTLPTASCGSCLAGAACRIDEYEYRIYAKTASLFEAATESAGELLRRRPERIEALARFGRELGKAFQIADDILDFRLGDGAGQARWQRPSIGHGDPAGDAPSRAHPDAAPWLERRR